MRSEASSPAKARTRLHRAALPASKARLWRAWARSAAKGLARNEASDTMAAWRFCSWALWGEGQGSELQRSGWASVEL